MKFSNHIKVEALDAYKTQALVQKPLTDQQLSLQWTLILVRALY